MTVTVRAAALEDSAALAGLMTELGYPTDEVSMVRRLEPLLACRDYTTLVADEGGDVVGMLGACLARHYARDGVSVRIVALSVTGRRRRCGIGRRLVAAAEGWARTRGAERLIVNTHDQRQDAHAFYSALGYERTGLRFARSI